MSTLLLAQVFVGSVAGWAILAVVIAALVGIVLVAVRAAGVGIPPWVIQVFWIVVIAVVCILAIKFVVQFAGA